MFLNLALLYGARKGKSPPGYFRINQYSVVFRLCPECAQIVRAVLVIEHNRLAFEQVEP